MTIYCFFDVVLVKMKDNEFILIELLAVILIIKE